MLLAACMLLSASAFAIDQHEPGFYEEQVQLAADNLQEWWEENYGEGDKVAPYEETVELSIVNYYNSNLEANMATWNEWWGETLEENRYVDAIARALNIDLNYDWLVNSANDGYITKLRLEIAAGNIPDMFLVTSQTDLLQLAEAELIIPVEELIDTYFTSVDRDIIYSDGGMMMEMATYDGQVYGIPRSISDTDTFSYIWLRKDWMDALELEAPTTIDELTALMDAFMAADFDGNGIDDTYGMLLDSSLYYPARGLFAGFGAYPEFWVEDDGQLVWGGTQDSVKNALAYLRSLYEGGYINPEFITRDNNDALADVLNGQCGVLYAGHWVAHNLQTLNEQDPESEWICVDLPSLDGSPVRQYLNPTVRGWVAISAECEHPEAVAKIIALCTFCATSGVTDGTWWFSNDEGQTLEPFQAGVSSWDNYNTYLNLLECFETGDESVLRGKAITYWGNMSSSSEWAWMHMFGPGEYTPMVVLGRAIEEDLIEYNGFLGAQSEFMQDRWSAITDEQLLTFTKIIIGEVELEEGFAAWLDTFDSMGGAQITEEVNEWYANK